jgi:glyoxylase-like metal-dependent hydrolase (beta-lactamase superfamily II)
MTGPVIHTYRAAETGLFVNSYLVESESGVVIVDTNLLVSDIEALRARLAALKKPLRAIFVTHAHPDHFNGVAALVRDGEVPVHAAVPVAKVIGEIADAKRPSGGRCTAMSGRPRPFIRTRCWPAASR